MDFATPVVARPQAAAIPSSVPVRLRELHPRPGHELVCCDGTVIGRATGCEIHVDDPLVSRRHARVLCSEIGTGIEDLGSSNGLYVNGERAPGITPLHPCDVIQVGGTLWVVLCTVTR
jgi:pSer/pThr/pTyr-binding forkhead associated (FHA) protein